MLDSISSTCDSVDVVDSLTENQVKRLQFIDSPQVKQISNVSISSGEITEYIWDQSSDFLLNDTSIRMDDTMDIFSYRHSLSHSTGQRKVSLPKTPARFSINTAKLFDKMVIPKTLFSTSSPILRSSNITSSPILRSSNRHRY